MAKREDDDIEALLAEVDRSLSGGGSRPTPVVEPRRTPARRGADALPAESSRSATAAAAVVRRLRLAGISAAVAAAVVFGLFAVTPFLGAVSGAAGAAIAAFVAVLVLPRRR